MVRAWPLIVVGASSRAVLHGNSKLISGIACVNGTVVDRRVLEMTKQGGGVGWGSVSVKGCGSNLKVSP